jgi:hypothetical protein
MHEGLVSPQVNRDAAWCAPCTEHPDADFGETDLRFDDALWLLAGRPEDGALTLPHKIYVAEA